MVANRYSTSVATYSSKRRKPKATKNAEPEDRISSLPAEVLHRILSFLPTKYAVGTSILSTRWKNLWASVSNYDFDDELLLLPRRHLNDYRCDFSNFVDRVLMLQKASSIQKFYLNCSEEYDTSRLNLWISSAIMHDVEELEICLSAKNSLVLPRGLFDCKTLVVLKLSSTNLDIGAPTSIYFPNLKILHLHPHDCLDDNLMNKFIAGCPILEELCIRRFVFDQIESMCVRSSTLRRLILYSCVTRSENHKYSLVVEAPSLEFLDLIDHISEEFDIIELSRLSTACLSVSKMSKQFIPSGEYGKNLVVNLLCKISNVKHLHLSHHIEKSVAGVFAAGIRLGIFRNLTYLNMEVERSWQFVSDLLEVSPNLKVLVCTKVKKCTQIAKGPHVPHCCTWKPSDSVPSCISSRIQRIQLSGFDGCQTEMELVGYILKNAEFLQELKITSHKLDLLLQSNILKELLLFPRVSTTCQIEFS